jgi:hypothetical protein
MLLTHKPFILNAKKNEKKLNIIQIVTVNSDIFYAFPSAN